MGLWSITFGLLMLSSASAHTGPPFPVLVDVSAGDDILSVWADPDIGEATFYIVLETPDGDAPPEPERVSLWVQPISERLPRVSYPAERQRARNRLQYYAEPQFDQRDFWTVGFVIERAGGDAVEILTQVESTPPGTGPWDLLIYLFPFAFVGVLWLMALSRMRRRRREILAMQKREVSVGHEPPGKQLGFDLS